MGSASRGSAAVALEPVEAGVVCAALVVSRVVYSLAGVQFDATPLSLYWQYLPIDVLRGDLAAGLVALHSQPPVFNLFLGVGLKTAAPFLFFELSFAAATIVLGLSLVRILRGLGCGRALALAAAIAFILNPAYVLYEHWLFYSLFEAAGLTAAVAALLAWGDGAARGRALLAFALCGTALVGLRSLFHPAWALGVVAICGWLGWRHGRRLSRLEALGLAAPLMLGLILMAKNQWLIGEATTSSWTGMNLSRVAFSQVSQRDLDVLIAEGRLSPLAKVGGFLPSSAYEPYAALLPVVEVNRTLAGHPALALPFKNGGQPNFNYRGYIGVSRALWRDATTYIAHDPRRYLANVGEGFSIFGRPASDYALLEPNRSVLEPYLRRVRRVLYPADTPWLIWFSAAVAVAGGGVLALARSALVSPGLRMAAAFAGFTVAWLVVVGNGLELGENNRFRVAIDPILFASVVGLCHLLLARVGSRRALPREPGAGSRKPARRRALSRHILEE